eukprot:CAMPEP_0203824048 /NCGR_PEP_ID=MMETSP0115-20131106/50806_1 /ASSEMBLY_ACC=CAM_ASM_000227 /TAXON_ID=33651 /ORGANISM="Bicosoecid sp, Strain ms1" /LENGTH=1784 /DNA_ID=CAMNT_0050733083 /DNA_START=63 /DNA_END=5417 /DNA_ORIENTATION=+
MWRAVAAKAHGARTAAATAPPLARPSARLSRALSAGHLHAPKKAGLYDPAHEHDACGTGFIADLTGVRTHTTVLQALEAVENIDHRGAAAADGLTGDGVGIMTQVPHRFFKKKLAARGLSVDRDTDIGVGVMFMPQDRLGEAHATAKGIVEAAIAESGLRLLTWRTVPVGEYALGKDALATLPDIQHVIVERRGGISDAEFERRLYVVRRRIENRSKAAGIGDQLAIPSFSHRTIVYKGLVVAPNLRHLYPDLNDSDQQSSIALFHQRYSTNTVPMWGTAQPFRYLAHNGEVNTLQGNLAWMRMREETLKSSKFAETEFPDLLPVCQGGSDSADLDNVFELLVQAGRDPLHAMAMLVPEAYEGNTGMDADLRAFYEYQRTLMEPWDGPAALCFTDGRVAAASMDRNGLRPLRYWKTTAGKVICGSEVGVVDVPVEKILERGRLGPGEMIAVDVDAGQLLGNDAIKRRLSTRRPYRTWIDRSVRHVRPDIAGLNQVLSYDTIQRVLGPVTAVDAWGKEAPPSAVAAHESRQRLKKAFGYAKEDEELILRPMASTAHEPVGSMGDDAPLAALSHKPQLPYRFLKQRFAEVTNPPIDPLLERDRMSLSITFGRKGMLLEESQHASFLLRFPSPVITESQLSWLKGHEEFVAATLPTTFAADGVATVKTGIDDLCARAEAAVDAGASYLVLSDRTVSDKFAAIPAALAVGAVHHHLISCGKRMRASILVESGEPREDHHIAVLIGYGASLVNPYLAFETVAEIAGRDAAAATAKGEVPALTVERALANYRSALEDGLLRIMSKMGIATVDSYRGAQVFEALGLSQDVVDRCFRGTTARLPAVGWETITADALARHTAGFSEPLKFKRGTALPRSGAYMPIKDGEPHAYNPMVFNKLRASSLKPRKEGEAVAPAYEKYVDEVTTQAAEAPISVRDLLDYVPARAAGREPVPLSEVESAEDIARRFCTQAMSHGSISREAHEALSHAANILGSRSNTGEGGEDAERFKPYAADVEITDPAVSKDARWFGEWAPKAGSLGGSKIKQVASARFGVTPTYLVSAEQLEIKAAQGSKPGEGGHIPGHKVTKEVARNRHSPEGVTLISPPPHHDIYSIEDLAQLIYDLKRVNSRAPVSVKLVSQAGVGTIAAGVAKAQADIVQLSGHDGGTGASPLASIKNAGLPWELGLAETQQVLVANGLRDRMTLRVDGGIKTGRDVVMAALLGADEFGFGTSALVALGCVMARKCHLNTCPVGIATQDPERRAKFAGKPEDVVTFLLHTAESVRHILADMGARSLDDIVGRTDLLRAAPLRAAAEADAGYADALMAASAAGEAGSFTPVRTNRGVMDVGALLHAPHIGDATLAAPGAETPVPVKSRDRNQRRDPSDRVAPLFGSHPKGVDLDEAVWSTCRPALDRLFAAAQAHASDDEAALASLLPEVLPNRWGRYIDIHFPIFNSSRSVGARLSGEIARRFGEAGLGALAGVVPVPRPPSRTAKPAGASDVDTALRRAERAPGGTMKLQFHGVAGQSFGAFISPGMELVLRGEAHDFVGKGMAGGDILVTPPADARFQAPATPRSGGTTAAQASVIVGNACLFGATGGRLFAAGRAGERFAVRNSGATAVVMGAGDHCCEYMTNGTVVVLGNTGRNFGAGMSGGRAFVLDAGDRFLDSYNASMVVPSRVEAGSPADVELFSLVQEFAALTGEPVARALVEEWADARRMFWHVQPRTAAGATASEALAMVPQWDDTPKPLELLQSGWGLPKEQLWGEEVVTVGAESDADAATTLGDATRLV